MAPDTTPFVGLVVVSHSRLIAEGTAELAGQMAGPEVRIVPAGGMADGTIGTDAARIAEALGEADTGAGVVVLADLGSAVLSTRTALELLDDPAASGCRRARSWRAPSWPPSRRAPARRSTRCSKRPRPPRPCPRGRMAFGERTRAGPGTRRHAG